MTCKHENFVAHADVQRIARSETDPQIDGFYVELRIHCAECDIPFVFRGLPMGLSQAHPTGDLLSECLTAPIYPKGDPYLGLGLPGLDVAVYEKPDPSQN